MAVYQHEIESIADADKGICHSLAILGPPEPGVSAIIARGYAIAAALAPGDDGCLLQAVFLSRGLG